MLARDESDRRKRYYSDVLNKKNNMDEPKFPFSTFWNNLLWGKFK